jgi:hypothetical protein
MPKRLERLFQGLLAFGGRSVRRPLRNDVGPTGPVHFVHLGGAFLWQHARAIRTAEVHGAPITIWHTDDPHPRDWSWPTFAETTRRHVLFRSLDLPRWLRDHPIQLANVKDLYVWRILHQHGGMYLDLDTISLQPCWDLLNRDVLVSSEWPHYPDWEPEHPYNSAVVVARAGASALAELATRALVILESGESRWGKTGPHLLTHVVRERPDAFEAAPFGVLNGWRNATIPDYYDGARPGPEVRVIHLYSSSWYDRFVADRWWPE